MIIRCDRQVSVTTGISLTEHGGYQNCGGISNGKINNRKSGILPDSDGRASSRSLSSPESNKQELVGRDKVEAYLPGAV